MVGNGVVVCAFSSFAGPSSADTGQVWARAIRIFVIAVKEQRE